MTQDMTEIGNGKGEEQYQIKEAAGSRAEHPPSPPFFPFTLYFSGGANVTATAGIRWMDGWCRLRSSTFRFILD